MDSEDEERVMERGDGAIRSGQWRETGVGEDA